MSRDGDRAMMAKSNSGDVSLTTGVCDVRVQLGLGVVTSDSATTDLDAHFDFGYFRQLRRAPEAQ